MTNNLPILVKELEVEYKKGKNILIHCHAGAQRSATVVTAFLMYMLKTDMEMAIKHVLKCSPNAFWFGGQINFLRSLEHFNQVVKQM